MVSRTVVALLLLAVAPAWGGEPRQLCLACHTAHHVERGACSDCHRGNPASERKNIAHAGMRGGKYARFTLGDRGEAGAGERLMERLACRRCHVSGGRGNRLAVSLDGAAIRKSAEELALSIRRPVAAMPVFALTEDQITTLVNAILAGSAGRETGKSSPVRIHFINSAKKSEDLFSKKCGSCHRMLSPRLGAVGAGVIGPDLSGLFSEYYPKTFRDGDAWNARNLRDWLKNPREVRAGVEMQPVTLTEAEMKELETIFTAAARP